MNIIRKLKNNMAALLALLFAIGMSANAHAQSSGGSTPPIDFTSTASTIAGYVPVVAALGLVVFAAIYGLRICIKAFKGVAK